MRTSSFLNILYFYIACYSNPSALTLEKGQLQSTKKENQKTNEQKNRLLEGPNMLL